MCSWEKWDKDGQGNVDYSKPPTIYKFWGSCSVDDAEKYIQNNNESFVFTNANIGCECGKHPTTNSCEEVLAVFEGG